ncbi:hypothetical protein PVAP13_3KG049364 [Panicum virgatum]|uniref:Uncharacterized protein n=1 Tax=Panicum virgatum TaxID=38727 RepID=A0A8T0UPA3_PANVG|nr:hypothetical protein PVAP13_3KG049364 [Panicum virgatum]
MEIKSTEGYMGECGEIYVPQPSTEDRLGGREQQIVHCPVTEASLTGKKSYGNLEVIIFGWHCQVWKYIGVGQLNIARKRVLSQSYHSASCRPEA